MRAAVRFHAVSTPGEQLSVEDLRPDHALADEHVWHIDAAGATVVHTVKTGRSPPANPVRRGFDASEQGWSLNETTIRPATTPSAILLSRGNSTARAFGLARCSASRSEKGE
jgi:hypothetical protein